MPAIHSNAIDLIADSLKGRSYLEVKEILDGFSQVEIDRIQFLLDFRDKQTNKAALHVTKKLIGKTIPHDLCPKRHCFASIPVLVVALFAHRKLGVHPVVSKYSISLTVIFAGAYGACNPISGIPHFIQEGFFYCIHGLGLMPIAEVVAKKLKQKEEKYN